MLFELLMAPFWLLVDMIIGFLSIFAGTPTIWVGIDVLTKYVSYALYMFGNDFFLTVIGMIVFFLTINMAWVIIEWLYKKVPGIS